jgi:mono/diheme cytochrome c family protein
MRSRTLLSALVLATAPLTAAANDGMPAAANMGHLLIQSNCGACHATEPGDVSRNAEAPAFRDVAKRYPPEDLGEALAEGIITGHPDMPEFVFQPDEIGAIIAYLEWLRAQ